MDGYRVRAIDRYRVYVSFYSEINYRWLFSPFWLCWRSGVELSPYIIINDTCAHGRSERVSSILPVASSAKPARVSWDTCPLGQFGHNRAERARWRRYGGTDAKSAIVSCWKVWYATFLIGLAPEGMRRKEGRYCKDLSALSARIWISVDMDGYRVRAIDRYRVYVSFYSEINYRWLFSPFWLCWRSGVELSPYNILVSFLYVRALYLVLP
jgi:hypothetical protein